MTSNHHAPYDLGYTRATMDGTKGCKTARFSQSHKTILSSDCRLQPAYMKPELLVTVGQPYYGEYVPGPCTHRPSRHGSREHLKSVGRPQEIVEAAAEGGPGDWDEVVTR